MVRLQPDARQRKNVIEIKNLIETSYPVAVQDLNQVKSNLFVFTDQRSARKFILKLHDPLCKANLPVLSKIYGLTSQHGFAPLSVPTTAGGYLADSDHLVFSLHEFLASERIDDRYESLLARRLAGLHRLLSSTRLPPLANHFKRIVADMAYAAAHYRLEGLIPLIHDTQQRLQKSPRQIIHGDLHPANIVPSGGQIFFIDFDSATYSAAAVDVAFSAFRCFGDRPEKIKQFVGIYNRSDPPGHLAAGDIWIFLVYSFLERILFILVERDHGHVQWLSDLNNQQGFLTTACGMLNKEQAGYAPTIDWALW